MMINKDIEGELSFLKLHGINTELLDEPIAWIGVDQISVRTVAFDRSKSVLDNIKLLSYQCEKLLIYPSKDSNSIYSKLPIMMDMKPGTYGFIRIITINPAPGARISAGVTTNPLYWTEERLEEAYDKYNKIMFSGES